MAARRSPTHPAPCSVRCGVRRSSQRWWRRRRVMVRTGLVGAAEEHSRPGAAAHCAAGRACLRPTGPSLHVRPGRQAPQGTLAQRGPAVRPCSDHHAVAPRALPRPPCGPKFGSNLPCAAIAGLQMRFRCRRGQVPRREIRTLVDRARGALCSLCSLVELAPQFLLLHLTPNGPAQCDGVCTKPRRARTLGRIRTQRKRTG